jgi:hypothetical protein
LSRSSQRQDDSRIIRKIEESGSRATPYIAGIILGIVLIAISIDVQINASYLYTILMVILLYFVIDHGHSKRNRIRMIELHQNHIRIFKGKNLKIENINLSDIKKATLKKRLLNRNISLMLETPSKSKFSKYTISGEIFRNSDMVMLFDELCLLTKQPADSSF